MSEESKPTIVLSGNISENIFPTEADEKKTKSKEVKKAMAKEKELAKKADKLKQKEEEIELKHQEKAPLLDQIVHHPPLHHVEIEKLPECCIDLTKELEIKKEFRPEAPKAPSPRVRILEANPAKPAETNMVESLAARGLLLIEREKLNETLLLCACAGFCLGLGLGLGYRYLSPVVKEVFIETLVQ